MAAHRGTEKQQPDLSNQELRADFSPEGKVRGLKIKMGRLDERLQKSWNVALSQSQTKKCKQYVRIIMHQKQQEYYAMHKNKK